MERVTNWSSVPQAAGLFPPGSRGCQGLLQGEHSCWEAGGRHVGTAPYYQRPEFCCHQSSRDTVTHTETLDSGTGGRYGLGQGQSRLDGRVKPEECIPCRPIMLAWLPAEAAKCCGELLCKQPPAACTKCRGPVGWGRSKVAPGAPQQTPVKE